MKANIMKCGLTELTAYLANGDSITMVLMPDPKGGGMMLAGATLKLYFGETFVYTLKHMAGIKEYDGMMAAYLKENGYNEPHAAIVEAVDAADLHKMLYDQNKEDKTDFDIIDAYPPITSVKEIGMGPKKMDALVHVIEINRGMLETISSYPGTTEGIAEAEKMFAKRIRKYSPDVDDSAMDDLLMDGIWTSQYVDVMITHNNLNDEDE